MPQAAANGLTLEYESFGDPGAPALVLAMGLGLQMIMWPEALCEALARSGFRVVRFDNRDIGLSTQLDALGTPNMLLQSARYALHLPVQAPYRIDDMARDTLGLLDALGIERAHLVGASMGGMIVQNVAAMAPARVLSVTSIMSTTGSRKLPGPTSRARRALMTKPAKRGDIEGATQRLMKVLRIIGSQTYPPDPVQLRIDCERHVRRSYNPSGAIRQLVAIAATGDRTEVVKRIQAPALVIHGDEDPLLRPACGEATARAINEAGGRARLEIVKGMGHDLPVPLLPRLAEAIAAHCMAAN